MSLDWVLEPISADEPCGPNLDTSDDADFVEYYFDALGRIPERYVKPGMETENGKRTEDQIFDPKSIDIKEEVKRITALLERSRDIRLLTLLAQFECLAGRPVEMANAIDAIAGLISTFGDAAHPAIEGDVSERRDSLNELAQPISILTALRYTGLTGTTDATLRKLQVAEGRFSPHTGEDNLNLSAMQSAIGNPGNRKKVDAVFDAFVRMTDSLRKIASACKTNESVPFAPSLDPTLALLEELRGAITSARPDLRGAEADLTDGADATATPEEGDAHPADQGATESVPAPAALPASAVKSHAEARQALVSCETYFQSNEPSSAALLLIRQGRQLIGQPLVVALETLLPQECGKAIVEFGPQSGFAIAAGRLKALSEQNLPGPKPGEDDPEVSEPPVIKNTADVANMLKAVEEFFRAREKSSPVPVLLQRARSYLDKDFQAIIDELIPRAPQSA